MKINTRNDNLQPYISLEDTQTQLAEIFQSENLDDMSKESVLATELLNKIYDGFRTNLHDVRHDAKVVS